MIKMGKSNKLSKKRPERFIKKAIKKIKPNSAEPISAAWKNQKNSVILKSVV
jgi:hypothetical protein